MAGSVRFLVAKNIKSIRLLKGLSQEKLAKKCGMSLRFISRAENSPQNLTLESLETISLALGVSVTEIFLDRVKTSPRPSKKTVEAIDETIRILESYRTLIS